MADPEHLPIIKQGVDPWKKWREENIDISPILTNVDLRGAELIEADLHRADFSAANLRRANLSAANLCGAEFAWTNITDIDMRNVIGLETIMHQGPSSIGIDTIFKSAGKIPHKFLEGAGKIPASRNAHRQLSQANRTKRYRFGRNADY